MTERSKESSGEHCDTKTSIDEGTRHCLYDQYDKGSLAHVARQNLSRLFVAVAGSDVFSLKTN